MVNDSATSSASRHVADSAHEAVEEIAAKTERAEERIRQAASDAEERVRASAGRASEGSSELAGDLAGRIQEHPMASVGITFAAGYLIASLFRR